MPTPGKTGRLPARCPTELRDLSEYAELPTPPPAFNGYGLVREWPMYANDQIGDCTLAAAAHLLESWNSDLPAEHKAAAVAPPSTDAVVRAYFRATGGQDSGLVEANVLREWATSGLWGSRIGGYVPAQAQNVEQLRRAMAAYGAVYLGVNLPEEAERQFEAGEPWTIDGKPTQPIGGHAVPAVGYDATGLYVVTWGRVQRATWEWWLTYGEEAWVVLAPEFVNAKGGLEHLDIEALRADLAKIGVRTTPAERRRGCAWWRRPSRS